MPALKILNYIGQNTIGFYFMSGALPIVLSMVVNRLMPQSNAVGFVFVLAGSAGVGYGLVYLMNRFTPWIFDLRLLCKKH